MQICLISIQIQIQIQFNERVNQQSSFPKFYKHYIVNLNHILLITAGLYNGSKIVNGDRTLHVFYKN